MAGHQVRSRLREISAPSPLSVRQDPATVLLGQQDNWETDSVNVTLTGLLKAGVIAGAVAFVSGCATTNAAEDEMAQLKAQLAQAQAAAASAQEQASQARFMAERAMDAARTANNCCTANTERMERMFKKSMKK